MNRNPLFTEMFFLNTQSATVNVSLYVLQIVAVVKDNLEFTNKHIMTHFYK